VDKVARGNIVKYKICKPLGYWYTLSFSFVLPQSAVIFSALSVRFWICFIAALMQLHSVSLSLFTGLVAWLVTCWLFLNAASAAICNETKRNLCMLLAHLQKCPVYTANKKVHSSNRQKKSVLMGSFRLCIQNSLTTVHFLNFLITF